jgi:hypothetical protein
VRYYLVEELISHTEAYHGVIASAFRHFLGNERHFERAGHPCHVERRLVAAMPAERVECASEEFGGDEFVETGSHDADALSLCGEFSF